MIDGLQGKAGQTVPIEVARGGQGLTLSVRPYADSVPGPGGKMQLVARIGIARREPEPRIERLGFGDAVKDGFVRRSTRRRRSCGRCAVW